ncbi:MAG TPA: hypothetical protein GXZ47_05215 [Treponema sp.]|nr:hypothetical protein [Treponema sp.]
MESVKTIDLKDAIRTRYGSVRRAHEYHLYTAKGKRLLDLYQEAGSAILGWRAGKSKLVFKSMLDRGLTGSFPCDAEGELVRAVQEVVPQYSEVRWYVSQEKARRACAGFLDLWSEIPLMESPLLHPEASSDIGPGGDSPLSAAKELRGVQLWRPWLDEAFYAMSDRVDSAFLHSVHETLDTMVLSSPLPFASGVTLAVFAPRSKEALARIPPSDSVAPALLSALARAFHDLSAAIFARTESDWIVYDEFVGQWWDRRGPYLVPKMRPSRYTQFFYSCLDQGLLISPNYHVPSIIPFTADLGEFKAFQRSGAL